MNAPFRRLKGVGGAPSTAPVLTGGPSPQGEGSAPANIEPYVRVLGIDGAVEFLLAFGGAELALGRNPQARGALAKLVGRDKAAELAAAAEHLPRRVPLAKQWIARVLKGRGLPNAEIARTLHVSDVTVRALLATGAKAEERREKVRAQFDLFRSMDK